MPRRYPQPAVSLALLAALLILAGCAANRPNLEGAWECLQPPPPPGRAPVVKILADGHFAFGAPEGPDGPALAGGGTYEQAGDHYVETVTYHWAHALVGQVVDFDCKVEGDLWYHRARFDANGVSFNIDEVWRRAKEPRPAS